MLWPFQFLISCFRAPLMLFTNWEGNAPAATAILTRPIATATGLIVSMLIFNITTVQALPWLAVAYLAGWVADLRFHDSSGNINLNSNSILLNGVRGLALGFLIGIWL